MIKIEKSDKPSILINKGAIENLINFQEYNSFVKDYEEGVRKFDFKKEIYGDTEVKKKLKDDQNNKCAFCETKFDDIFGYGVVEHFRPKAAYKKDKGDKLNYPGYYWLAYDWNNLLFSCERCNSQGNKGNIFPLINENIRIKNHNSSKLQEDFVETLLVNPYFENPEEHLGFREEIAFAKTDKGKKTIDILNLNCSALQEKRREYLNKYSQNCIFEKININNNKEILKILPVNEEELNNLIENAKTENIISKSNKGQYFGMINSKLINK